MEAAAVLLLDLDPGDALGPAVRRLAAEREEGFRLECRAVPFQPGKAWEREAAGLLEIGKPDLVIIGMGGAPREHGLPAVRALRDRRGDLPLLAVLQDSDPDALGELLALGGLDFATFPLRALDFFPRIHRLLSRRRREDPLVLRLKEKLGLRQMIGASPRFLEEVGKLPAIARCDASVLVAGETGTGKEMCARAIHYLGPRADRPFVGLNCGAVPADLVENELFGHEREAFTGAATRRPGLVGEADTGTLFLDEVDSLPSPAQVKLLRFLQEKEYRALGSARTLKADVRIIAASNLDLERAVAEGRIRRDLYYRLNVVTIHLPPLRDRKEDIPALLDHFLGRYCAEYRVGPFEVRPEARRKLLAHPWPGNIRELEHAVQRAVLLAAGSLLGPEDFPLPGETSPAAEEPFGIAKARLIRDFERDYIRTLLLMHRGNVSEAARSARKDRRAFWHLVQKHGIEVGPFRA